MTRKDPLSSAHYIGLTQRREEKRRARAEEAHGDFPPHPLFPVEAGEPRPNVRFIQVTRMTKGGQIWARRMFKAEELTSIDQICDLFGGGTYELVARNEVGGKPGDFVKKHTWPNLPGEPLPLNDEDAVSKAQEQVVMAGAPGMPSDPLSMMFFMMQRQDQQAAERARDERAAAERRAADDRAAADRQMQLMMTMMTNQTQVLASVFSQKGGESAALVEATGKLANTFAEGRSRKAEGSGVEQVGQLLDLMKKLKDSPLNKEDSMAELIAAAGQVMGPIAQMQQNHLQAAALQMQQEEAKKQAAAAAPQNGAATIVDAPAQRGAPANGGAAATMRD